MKSNTQNGNVIAIILIAVALFAALGYAFVNTSRTSTSFISDEEACAYANQIIAYGNEVRQAVKRLTLRGCSDTEISFENDIVTDYVNPNAPSDKSCHIYDIAGGGLQYKELDQANHTGIVKGIEVVSAGTNCADIECTEIILVMRLSTNAETDINGSKLCGLINKKLNHDATLKDVSVGDDTPGTASYNRFKGVYTYDKTIDESELYGKNQYCVRVNSTISTFHQILLAR